MVEGRLKPQHLSVQKKIERIIAENQLVLIREQALGRVALPRQRLFNREGTNPLRRTVR